MRHIVHDSIDVPPPAPAYDRRKTPDRRTIWRGGRRDSDWHDRPDGALGRFAAEQARASLVRRALSVLHVW